jgi:hypothetical protein
LWLSGKHVWPYWGGMGVKVWVLPRGFGGPGHNMCVLPRGLGVPGHKVLVLPCGLEGPVDLKSKGRRAPGGFETGFGALGGRGGDLASDSQIEDLWIYG